MDTTKINNSVTKIDDLGFEKCWNGTSYETQLEHLKNTMSDLKQCIKDIEDFDDILDKKEIYIGICDQISNLYASISGCTADHDDENCNCSCGTNTSKIEQLEIERKELRAEIIGLLGKFEGIAPEIMMPADLSKINDVILSFEEQLALTEIYMAMPEGNIAKCLEGKIDENGVLIEDGYKYIQERIDSVKSQFTGTERNYYVAMEVIELSILAGVRSPYEHNGTTGATIYTHNPVDTKWISDGIDCNAYVSMVIYDDESIEKWLTVGQYYYAGDKVQSYEDAKPGDIIANGGHVGIVMANNPETKQLIINHASSHKHDMKYEVVSYVTLENDKHIIRRVDRNYVTPEVKSYLEENQ